MTSCGPWLLALHEWGGSLELNVRWRGKTSVIGLVVLAVVGLAFGAGHAWSSRPRRPCTDLGALKAFPIGIVVKVGCAPVFVVNPQGRVIVLLNEDPAVRGARLIFNDQTRVFEAVRGNVFDISGTRISGPDLGDMWTCPSALAHGHVVLAGMTDANPQTVQAACKQPHGQ